MLKIKLDKQLAVKLVVASRNVFKRTDDKYSTKPSLGDSKLNPFGSSFMVHHEREGKEDDTYVEYNFIHDIDTISMDSLVKIKVYSKHKKLLLSCEGVLGELSENVMGTKKNKVLIYNMKNNKEVSLVLDSLKVVSKLIMMLCYHLTIGKKAIYIDEALKSNYSKKNGAKSPFKASNITTIVLDLDKETYHTITKTGIKKTHEWRVTEFNRRGHWRNYKSGKKVWISNTVVKPLKSEKVYSKDTYVFK